jgi:hypothetical protein
VNWNVGTSVGLELVLELAGKVVGNVVGNGAAAWAVTRVRRSAAALAEASALGSALAWEQARADWLARATVTETVSACSRAWA